MPGGLVTPGTCSGPEHQLSGGGEHTYASPSGDHDVSDVLRDPGIRHQQFPSEGKRFRDIINARLQLGKGDGDLVDPVQVQI